MPGNLLLIPVENSLLYVRPLYIEATGTTAVPELQLVIVGVGPEVKIADSFEAALAAAIPGLQADVGPGPISASPDSSEDDSSSGAPAEPDDLDSSDELSIEELLAKSREAFDRADAALRAGDLAGYQRWVESAAGYIAKAQRLLGQASSREEADSA